MPNADEFEWIRRALARYEQPLLRFAAQLVGPSAARDVVQDTFLALCKAEPSAIEARLKPWLFVVCRNRALDLLRERRRLSQLDDHSEQPCDERTVAELERRQSISRVYALIQKLPQQQREILVLKFSAGMSYREIAEVMELTETHVGVLLHVAVKRLRKRLAEQAAECVSAR